METWEQYKKLFDINLYSLLDEIMKNKGVQQQFIDYNQFQLFEDGLDANGKFIRTIEGDPYTKNTKQIKSEKGQATDHVTLHDTGDFYNTFGVVIRENGYEIVADFMKGSSDIRDNFSSLYDFLGLTEESLEKIVNETILPKLEKMILEHVRR